MTTLAKTSKYLVEFEAGMLTIARFSDGRCLGLVGKRIAGDFRACVKIQGEESAIETYIAIADAISATWKPLYNVAKMRAYHGMAPLEQTNAP